MVYELVSIQEPLDGCSQPYLSPDTGKHTADQPPRYVVQHLRARPVQFNRIPWVCEVHSVDILGPSHKMAVRGLYERRDKGGHEKDTEVINDHNLWHSAYAYARENTQTMAFWGGSEIR